MFFWSHLINLYSKNQNCATYLNEKPKNVICKKIATPKSHKPSSQKHFRGRPNFSVGQLIWVQLKYNPTEI